MRSDAWCPVSPDSPGGSIFQGNHEQDCMFNSRDAPNGWSLGPAIGGVGGLGAPGLSYLHDSGIVSRTEIQPPEFDVSTATHCNKVQGQG